MKYIFLALLVGFLLRPIIDYILELYDEHLQKRGDIEG